ncbi:hypothetical protein HDU76_002597 [Blyttiomyces sp. JEL0837]|nr:hypothetical protein HDU76_002597 [Blyttiomyces sp. JEL0837]
MLLVIIIFIGFGITDNGVEGISGHGHGMGSKSFSSRSSGSAPLSPNREDLVAVTETSTILKSSSFEKENDDGRGVSTTTLKPATTTTTVQHVPSEPTLWNSPILMTPPGAPLLAPFQHPKRNRPSRKRSREQQHDGDDEDLDDGNEMNSTSEEVYHPFLKITPQDPTPPVSQLANIAIQVVQRLVSHLWSPADLHFPVGNSGSGSAATTESQSTSQQQPQPQEQLQQQPSQNLPMNLSAATIHLSRFQRFACLALKDVTPSTPFILMHALLLVHRILDLNNPGPATASMTAAPGSLVSGGSVVDKGKKTSTSDGGSVSGGSSMGGGKRGTGKAVVRPVTPDLDVGGKEDCERETSIDANAKLLLNLAAGGAGGGGGNSETKQESVKPNTTTTTTSSSSKSQSPSPSTPISTTPSRIPLPPSLRSPTRLLLAGLILAESQLSDAQTPCSAWARVAGIAEGAVGVAMLKRDALVHLCFDVGVREGEFAAWVMVVKRLMESLERGEQKSGNGDRVSSLVYGNGGSVGGDRKRAASGIDVVDGERDGSVKKAKVSSSSLDSTRNSAGSTSSSWAASTSINTQSRSFTTTTATAPMPIVPSPARKNSESSLTSQTPVPESQQLPAGVEQGITALQNTRRLVDSLAILRRPHQRGDMSVLEEAKAKNVPIIGSSKRNSQQPQQQGQTNKRRGLSVTRGASVSSIAAAVVGESVVDGTDNKRPEATTSRGPSLRTLFMTSGGPGAGSFDELELLPQSRHRQPETRQAQLPQQQTQQYHSYNGANEFDRAPLPGHLSKNIVEGGQYRVDNNTPASVASVSYQGASFQHGHHHHHQHHNLHYQPYEYQPQHQQQRYESEFDYRNGYQDRNENETHHNHKQSYPAPTQHHHHHHQQQQSQHGARSFNHSHTLQLGHSHHQQQQQYQSEYPNNNNNRYYESRGGNLDNRSGDQNASSGGRYHGYPGHHDYETGYLPTSQNQPQQRRSSSIDASSNPNLNVNMAGDFPRNDVGYFNNGSSSGNGVGNMHEGYDQRYLMNGGGIERGKFDGGDVGVGVGDRRLRGGDGGYAGSGSGGDKWIHMVT